MKLTICICTWNRAKLLRQSLESMTALRTPVGVDWNIVVVNNNCTDETDAVVGEFIDRLPLVLMHESTPGKSYALNRALDQAPCDWMVFTDDDVLVEPEWLEHYAAAMNAAGPDVAFLGGAVEPWFEVPPSTALATGIPTVGKGFCGLALPVDPEIRDPRGQLPYGVNCAVRMSHVGEQRFDVNFGPKGESRVTSEETRFFMALLDRGWTGRWAPGVELQHYVPASRLRLRYLARHIFDLGRLGVLTDGPPPGRKVLGITTWVVRELVQSVLTAPVNYVIGQHARFYRDISRACSRSGMAWECLRMRGKR